MYYVLRAGSVYGPYTADDLREMAAAGQLTATDSVRRGHESTWFPANRVRGLVFDQPAEIVDPVEIAATSPASRAPRKTAASRGAYVSKSEWWVEFSGFKRMIAPQIIRILFGVGCVLIVLAFVVICLDTINRGNFAKYITIFAGLPVVAAALILWRLMCESWILFFRIHETLREIELTLKRD